MIQVQDLCIGHKWVLGYEGLYSASLEGRIYSCIKNKFLKETKNIHNYAMVTLYKNGKPKNYSVHRLVAIAHIPNPQNKPCVDHINTNRTDNRVENLKWVTHQENCNNPITLAHGGEARRGDKHYFWGKKRTEDEKRKQSEAMKGRKLSEETKRKIGNSNRGKVRCEELRKRWSITRKGKHMGKSSPLSKRVGQFSISGILIKEWDCIADAQRSIGISANAISHCVCKRSKTAGGYVWKTL